MPWDAYAAEWYAERYGRHPTNRLVVDLLELGPYATVVDVGCGTLGHDHVRATGVVAAGFGAASTAGTRIRVRAGCGEERLARSHHRKAAFHASWLSVAMASLHSPGITQSHASQSSSAVALGPGR